MKYYGILVWKYILDDKGNYKGKKELVDLVKTENKSFYDEVLKLYKDMYCFYNYEIEIKEWRE